MKKSIRNTLILLSGISINVMAQATDLPSGIDAKNFDPATMLWYEAPASKWEEALPIGNGRLGAMVFGNPLNEHIQLNENTLYSGEPSSTYKDVNIQNDLPLVIKMM